MKQTEHRAHAHRRLHEKENDNMSITRSISVAQTDYSSKSELLCGLPLLLKPCETVQRKTTIILPRYLSYVRSERHARKTYIRSERGTRNKRR